MGGCLIRPVSTKHERSRVAREDRSSSPSVVSRPAETSSVLNSPSGSCSVGTSLRQQSTSLFSSTACLPRPCLNNSTAQPLIFSTIGGGAVAAAHSRTGDLANYCAAPAPELPSFPTSGQTAAETTSSPPPIITLRRRTAVRVPMLSSSSSAEPSFTSTVRSWLQGFVEGRGSASRRTSQRSPHHQRRHQSWQLRRGGQPSHAVQRPSVPATSSCADMSFSAAPHSPPLRAAVSAPSTTNSGAARRVVGDFSCITNRATDSPDGLSHNPTYQDPRNNAHCPVCGGGFGCDVTDRQINRHVDGCLVSRELSCLVAAGDERQQTNLQRWSRRYGQTVNGVIVFESSRRSSIEDCSQFSPGESVASLHLPRSNPITPPALPSSAASISGDDGTPTACRQFDHEALARSLLHVIRNEGHHGGGSEDAARARYLELEQTSITQFSAIGSLPFEQKQQWFYAQLNGIRVNFASSWVIIDVQRDRLLANSFNEFRSLGPHDFHKEFKFRFAGEPAQDAGGLSREWFTLISKHLFNPNNGLFLYSDVDNLTYQINPHSSINENHLEYFRFAGRVIGKAIFDRRVILCPLARPLLKQVLKRRVDMEDLAFVDQALYNSLEWMREHYVKDVIFETFSIEEDRFGEPTVVDLKPGGRGVCVSDENKEAYVELRMKHKIQTSIQDQVRALTEGLWGVIPLALLRVFDFQELELLINGLPVIDVDDWRRHTAYQGEYHDDHVIIRWFWDAVSKDFSQEERARLLQFSTGTSRVPPEGFKALESNRGQRARFTLQSVEWCDFAPFPRAHTCFNRLDLPKYKTQEELKKFLTWSIQMDVTGFGLDD